MVTAPDGVTWAKAEKLFAQADRHKPEKERFTGWKPSQNEAYKKFKKQSNRRFLIFFPTGEGKSKTGLALIASEGFDEVLVVAPQKTHPAWKRELATLGMTGRIVTHEMFRQDHFKPRRGEPILVDEVHKLGKRSGIGWKKLYKWSKMKDWWMPMILMSATPPYNEAERLYCVEVICDENPTHNYERWLQENCQLEPSRFKYYPDVVGLLNYDTTNDFLADKSWCAYVEDTADWTRDTLVLPTKKLDVFEEYGFSERHHRIVASDMEKRHKRNELQFIDQNKRVRRAIMKAIKQKLSMYPEQKKWLVFCSHKTVADALYENVPSHVWLITGDTKPHDIEPQLQGFIMAERGWLIGTSAIAEGVDGIDKTCTALLILDDIVGDDAKRRQVIGRILPRGNEDDRERVVITAAFK